MLRLSSTQPPQTTSETKLARRGQLQQWVWIVSGHRASRSGTQRGSYGSYVLCSTLQYPTQRPPPMPCLQSDLRLVCADNSGCKAVDQYGSGCSYAQAPATAYVGRSTLAAGPTFAVAMAARSVDSVNAPAWLTTGGCRVCSRLWSVCVGLGCSSILRTNAT